MNKFLARLHLASVLATLGFAASHFGKDFAYNTFVEAVVTATIHFVEHAFLASVN